MSHGAVTFNTSGNHIVKYMNIPTLAKKQMIAKFKGNLYDAMENRSVLKLKSFTNMVLRSKTYTDLFNLSEWTRFNKSVK